MGISRSKVELGERPEVPVREPKGKNWVSMSPKPGFVAVCLYQSRLRILLPVDAIVLWQTLVWCGRKREHAVLAWVRPEWFVVIPCRPPTTAPLTSLRDLLEATQE
jgi:hypothetical protein